MKVLEQHEKEKKDKYLQSCLEMRKDVGWNRGMRGLERGEGACHSTGRKWKHEYLQMVYYVRVRMAIVVVRANSLLICGSRVCQQPCHPLISDGAALGD